jgi:hypothetical protein
MSSSTARSVEIDFLRGLVLIVISLDHNTSGLLRSATLHTFAYCDASEVFVFLGGYASASAYVDVSMRRGNFAARLRFLKRAWAIYRAYLLTAALMLMCSAALNVFPATLPAVNPIWPAFSAHPIRTVVDVAFFRQQPFLSAVLPMYVLFASCVPLTVPFARRSPTAALLASLILWGAAPWFVAALPSASDEGWSFNPFAWQLMFTIGTLSRLHPRPNDAHPSLGDRCVTYAAIAVAVGIAFVKLCIDFHPSPGYMKLNLATIRIISFLSIAWLCAQSVRTGWIRALALQLPMVVTVGRQGLACFVGGAVFSIVTDVGLHLATQTPHMLTNWLIRLCGDLLDIGMLLLLGAIASRLKRANHLRSIVRNMVVSFGINGTVTDSHAGLTARGSFSDAMDVGAESLRLRGDPLQHRSGHSF